MAINLEKGGRINLKKEAPALKKVRLGLGWNANGTDTGTEFDLDVSVFICKNDHANMPKLISDEHFVFYNNKVSPDGAVVHHGDNRTGTGDGDDETVVVDLEKYRHNRKSCLLLCPFTKPLNANKILGKLKIVILNYTMTTQEKNWQNTP